MKEEESLNFLTRFFMITIRVHLSHFEKILITESGDGRSSTGHAFDKFFGGDKLISEYFGSKF